MYVCINRYCLYVALLYIHNIFYCFTGCCCKVNDRLFDVRFMIFSKKTSGFGSKFIFHHIIRWICVGGIGWGLGYGWGKAMYVSLVRHFCKSHKARPYPIHGRIHQMGDKHCALSLIRLVSATWEIKQCAFSFKRWLSAPSRGGCERREVLGALPLIGPLILKHNSARKGQAEKIAT